MMFLLRCWTVVYYGVSQTRTRVIFIAVREDVAEKVGLTFMNISQVFPEPDSDVIPVKDAMIDLEYDPEEVKYLTDKLTNTAYWKQTGSIMPIDPDKVLTGDGLSSKGSSLQSQEMYHRHNQLLLSQQWVVQILLLVRFIGLNQGS